MMSGEIDYVIDIGFLQAAFIPTILEKDSTGQPGCAWKNQEQYT